MNFDLNTFGTSDLLSLISIIATSVFSCLVWRATIAANKTAKAIQEAGEKEKRTIQNQNRFLVKYNLAQIENVLLAHSIEKGFKRNAKDDIQNAIEQIRDFDLTTYFNQEEIEAILDFISYLEEDFLKVFKKIRVYSVNFLYAKESDIPKIKEEQREYNAKERPHVEEALVKLDDLKSKIR